MNIRENIQLSSYNWFGTGGPARYFCEPQSRQDYIESLEFATEQNVAVFVLGDGANVLVSDTGFNGLVIHPKNTNIRILEQNSETRTTTIRAGSGVIMQNLIDFCLENGLIGLEDFSGIPGTVGGSVYINLHYFEHLLSDFFVRGEVVNTDSLEVSEKGAEWFGFGYDQSCLHDHNHILVSADFEVQGVSAEECAYARGRRDEIIRHRNRRYPESNTCGSFFRNFLPEEVDLSIDGAKMIYVAYYFDKLGIKGHLQSGGARVSSKHANMIVTDDSASSQDVIEVTRQMQQRAQDEFGVLPQPECQLIGFDEYPLIKSKP